MTGFLLCSQGLAYCNLSLLVFEFLVVEIPDASSPDPSDSSPNKSLSTNPSNTMSAVSSEARMVNGDVAEDGKIPVCGEIKDPNVKVTLQNKEIWDKFHACGTEMIITKAGRFVNHLRTLIFYPNVTVLGYGSHCTDAKMSRYNCSIFDKVVDQCVCSNHRSVSSLRPTRPLYECDKKVHDGSSFKCRREGLFTSQMLDLIVFGC